MPRKPLRRCTCCAGFRTTSRRTSITSGRRFAEEERKIHHGEAEKRSIYGEATTSEAKELRDEGIEVGQIPWLPRHDA